jgi:hypothetical protein
VKPEIRNQNDESNPNAEKSRRAGDETRNVLHSVILVSDLIRHSGFWFLVSPGGRPK